jgi:AcrR family transcriptional regulator
MSEIAKETGIGRATLYKYFSSVEAMLLAWHEQQISAHLGLLTDARDGAGSGRDRIEAVLGTYARIAHEPGRHGDSELAAFLHRDEQKHVANARRQLHSMIRDLLAEGAVNGDVRDDVAPDELANFCLHALAAAANLPSKAALDRLVKVTVAALRPPAATS